MTLTDIDRSHAVPLYHQIFLMLRDEIVTGARKFGAAVPTEQELATQHAVSRITARRALMELADHGFVERRQRIGTRVIHRAPNHPIEANVEQAVESLLAFGRDTTVRVIELSTCAPEPHVARQLALNEGAPVVRAVRVRSLDGEPLGEVVSYVPASLRLAVNKSDLTRTPMLALLRAAGHEIGGGAQTISGGVAGRHLSQLLGIDLRAPILRVERTVLDTQDQALLFTIASYRADRYRITIDLHTAGRIAADVP